MWHVGRVPRRCKRVLGGRCVTDLCVAQGDAWQDWTTDWVRYVRNLRPADDEDRMAKC